MEYMKAEYKAHCLHIPVYEYMKAVGKAAALQILIIVITLPTAYSATTSPESNPGRFTQNHSKQIGLRTSEAGVESYNSTPIRDRVRAKVMPNHKSIDHSRQYSRGQSTLRPFWAVLTWSAVLYHF